MIFASDEKSRDGDELVQYLLILVMLVIQGSAANDEGRGEVEKQYRRRAYSQTATPTE
jgi:hypothetical protein